MTASTSSATAPRISIRPSCRCSTASRPHTVGTDRIVYNVGAILGGFFFGPLSERIGRRRTIVIAALLAPAGHPAVGILHQPLMLAAGAFLIQVMVQGAWGVVPAHLNELSPAAARGTFPGFVYQLGNLFAAVNADAAGGHRRAPQGDYGLALAVVAGASALVIAVLTTLGREARGTAFSRRTPIEERQLTAS